MGLSRQSTALVLTAEQQPNVMQKKYKINKPYNKQTYPS